MLLSLFILQVIKAWEDKPGNDVKVHCYRVREYILKMKFLSQSRRDQMIPSLVCMYLYHKVFAQKKTPKKKQTTALKWLLDHFRLVKMLSFIIKEWGEGGGGGGSAHGSMKAIAIATINIHLLH